MHSFIKSASVAALAMLLIAVTTQAQELQSVPPSPLIRHPLNALAEGPYPAGGSAALEKRGYTCQGTGNPVMCGNYCCSVSSGCNKAGTDCGCGLGEECNGGCCDFTWSCDATLNKCTKLVFGSGSGSGSGSSSGSSSGSKSGATSLSANAMAAAVAMAAAFAHA
ncbi:hypothetical protein BGX26_005083 [Mortierella sp. AD094]|nr:hypothetical protein BGX26_005083 [Mortierella sp. AD094]